ncbi:hypothetical protein [Dendronalium sp. ChiSLP03b]|nr:hypothetical protein [Dendronalium sp. ChiSLP03b]MDZ8206463.1 hypothetical protein [Dendronalium sp. ChiSLP03b]
MPAINSHQTLKLPKQLICTEVLASQNYIAIPIKDNGSGISDEVQ